ELNYYAQDLINQIRKQAGTVPVTLTQNSIDYATALSKAAREEKYKYQSKEPITMHVAIPKDVVSKFGLDQFGHRVASTNELGPYPILASQENVSVDYLKKTIYDDIKFQLFDLGDNIAYRTRGTIYAQKVVGHLESQKKGAYVAVNFSNNGIINRINFLLFPNTDNDIKDPSKITPALINPNANNQEADAARKDLAASQAKLDAAQRTLTNAQNKQETAPLLREVVKTAKDKLAKAERTYQAELENSKNSASEETKAKLAVLAKAQASLKEKEAAQATAQKTAEEANAKLAELKAATANAQEKATAAATALEEAQRAVQAAKDYVTRLQNAPALLKEAEAALNDAKANLASKEETYRVENAKLEALKAALAALETDDPTNLVSKNERKVLKVTTTGVKKGKKPVQTYQAPAALPKTGSAESSLALAGLGLLSMLGLAFAKRRKA
ncbi:MAG: SEC10/PgrA surface exclusion domain-containing protein, partial [Streptococcus sp.]